jgi:hypothetical protein
LNQKNLSLEDWEKKMEVMKNIDWEFEFMKNWMESDYITGSQIFLSPIREEKDKE